MKEMCTLVPEGACPSCGKKGFVVHEMQSFTYLTNRDGVVVDYAPDQYAAVGMCTNCNKRFDMMPTPTGFIPITPLRRILLDYTPHIDNFLNDDLTNAKVVPNPMGVNSRVD